MWLLTNAETGWIAFWLLLQIQAMPYLTEITGFLDAYLQIHQYPQEQQGIWKPVEGTIKHLGFVLEPWPQIYYWIKQCQLDAVFVHRPWKLDIALVPAGTGILSYHLPFDEKLTLGYNPLLAAQLRMTDIEPIGRKEGRPLGMTGIISPVTLESFTAHLENLFGPAEQIYRGEWRQISKIAVMGAMTESLVLEVAQKGIHLYLTGQFRKPAFNAVAQTGLHVIAAGHLQSEIFGLRLLAEIIREKWPALQTYMAPA
jgi:putative NIF3 family GTP cyclohydrolase 1 type 2